MAAAVAAPSPVALEQAANSKRLKDYLCINTTMQTGVAIRLVLYIVVLVFLVIIPGAMGVAVHNTGDVVGAMNGGWLFWTTLGVTIGAALVGSAACFGMSLKTITSMTVVVAVIFFLVSIGSLAWYIGALVFRLTQITCAECTAWPAVLGYGSAIGGLVVLILIEAISALLASLYLLADCRGRVSSGAASVAAPRTRFGGAPMDAAEVGLSLLHAEVAVSAAPAATAAPPARVPNMLKTTKAAFFGGHVRGQSQIV